jgi:hypothetical protein
VKIRPILVWPIKQEIQEFREHLHQSQSETSTYRQIDYHGGGLVLLFLEDGAVSGEAVTVVLAVPLTQLLHTSVHIVSDSAIKHTGYQGWKSYRIEDFEFVHGGGDIEVTQHDGSVVHFL